MAENKRYIDGGEECIENQFLIDTETDESFFIDHGLDKIIKRLNEQDKEIKRLKCINRQLEERLDKSVALDMSRCGKYVFGVHGGSND